MTTRIARQLLLIACGCLPLYPALAADADAGQRFEHRMERSRFDVGPHRHEQRDGPVLRTLGDRGAFSFDTVTGAALAVPSAPGTPKGVPMLQSLPRGMTDDPDRHNAEVRRYLLAAGMPAAEVSGMHITATMGGGGPVSDGMQPSKSTLLWYTTHLERSLGGVPVEGSFAFSALDTEGKVITEGVYWPPIPAMVVRRAAALQQRLASPAEAAAFHERLRRLRPDVGDTRGEVKIVHTGAGHHGTFDARAVYSVIVRQPGGGKAQIVRFDDAGAGTVVRLPDEVKSLSDSPKVR